MQAIPKVSGHEQGSEHDPSRGYITQAPCPTQGVECRLSRSWSESKIVWSKIWRHSWLYLW